jgi:hypothetical protein
MHTNDLSSFKIGQFSHFPIHSHELSLNTVTNALIRALQSVNKRKKNIQCRQLKFFQCSQHKFYSSISLYFHYFVHSLYINRSSWHLSPYQFNTTALFKWRSSRHILWHVFLLLLCILEITEANFVKYSEMLQVV